jgi:hypothetical protein
MGYEKGVSAYKAETTAAAALNEGEALILSVPLHLSKQQYRNKLAQALNRDRQTYRDRFCIRIGTGENIAVFKNTVWGSEHLAMPSFIQDGERVWNFKFGRMLRPCFSLRPGCFYLGFLHDSSMPAAELDPDSRCSVNACPFPRHAGGDICLYHINWGAYSESLTGEAVDKNELFGNDDDPNPVMFSGREFELEREDYIFEYKGTRKRDSATMASNWPKQYERDSYFLGEERR